MNGSCTVIHLLSSGAFIFDFSSTSCPSFLTWPASYSPSLFPPSTVRTTHYCTWQVCEERDALEDLLLQEQLNNGVPVVRRDKGEREVNEKEDRKDKERKKMGEGQFFMPAFHYLLSNLSSR